MNYVEFNPQPTMGENVNGVQLVFRALNQRNEQFLEIPSEYESPFVNGFFAAVIEHLSDEDKKFLRDREETLRNICSAVAEFVKTDYDIIISRTVEKERVITINVPKERRVGLFKKEVYIDQETKTEKYCEKETLAYKGWRIERLVRKIDKWYGDPPDVMFFDYCLGADGQLYLVVSNNKTGKDVVVLNCVCYSPAFMTNKFCNVYSAAISGVIGALDAIPMAENDPIRNTHIRFNNDYYYNFPIQIDDNSSYPYAFLGGTINRLVNLLDDSSKKACCNKYEWMNTFLLPEKIITENDVSRVDSNTQRAGVSTRKKSFNEYVLFSASEVSRKPYAKQDDEFISNPTGCFLSVLLTERLTAADDLIKRYPQFRELAIRIIENHQQSITVDTLDNERQLAMNLAGEHINDDKEIFVLLTAYEAFLSIGTTDEKRIALHDQMAKTLLGLDIIIGDWEEFMVAVALWFFNTNNFQEEVKLKFMEIKDTPEYKEGGKRYNFNSFVKCGYKFVLDSIEDPGNAFLRHIIIDRRIIAERVESKYPDFKRVIQAMDVTDNALTNSGDFGGSFVNESKVICDFILDHNDILENQDFLILGAAIMSFMGRFEKSEENDGRMFIGRIEDIGEEIYTFPSIALYCAALWFADYKNYQQLLTDVIIDHERN